MADVLHSALVGTDLHEPKGKSPTPLDLVKNLANAYRVRIDVGAGVFRDMFVINTTDGTLTFQFGNDTDNPVYTFHGTGGVVIDGPLTTGIGQSKRKITSVVATPHAVAEENQTLLVNVAGAVTINLRAAATAGSGAWLEVKDVSGAAGANNITVDGSGAETIDGAATQVIATNYGSLTLVCNGTSWFIL